MKKLLFLLCVSALVFAGCSKNDEAGGKKSGDTYCWTFTVKTVTSVKGATVKGYPKTSKVTHKQCGLTAAQADELVKNYTSETTAKQGKWTVVIKITATKKLS